MSSRLTPKEHAALEFCLNEVMASGKANILARAMVRILDEPGLPFADAYDAGHRDGRASLKDSYRRYEESLEAREAALLARERDFMERVSRAEFSRPPAPILIDGYESGYAKATADVVAWLRQEVARAHREQALDHSHARYMSALVDAYDISRVRVEAGEHRGAADGRDESEVGGG